MRAHDPAGSGALRNNQANLIEALATMYPDDAQPERDPLSLREQCHTDAVAFLGCDIRFVRLCRGPSFMFERGECEGGIREPHLPLERRRIVKASRLDGGNTISIGQKIHRRLDNVDQHVARQRRDFVLTLANFLVPFDN